MSRLMRMALEEVREIKDEEDSDLSNLWDEFKDDIAKGSSILFGLENFKATVSKATTDEETLNKVLDAGYRLAVQGTVYQTNKQSVSMENNEKVSIESFSNNIKEIVRKIIAFIKESYERIKQFVIHLFGKKQKVEKNISEVNDLVKEKEDEIKTSNAEIIVVEPKPAFNLKTDNTKLLLELAPVKERKAPVIVIPKTISLGKETSIIYPHEATYKAQLHSGNYLSVFMYELERYCQKVNKAKSDSASALTALDHNVLDFCSYFKTYLENPSDTDIVENLQNLMKVIKVNYYTYNIDFIRSIANPALFYRKKDQDVSFVAEISGGNGFQAHIKELNEQLSKDREDDYSYMSIDSGRTSTRVVIEDLIFTKDVGLTNTDNGEILVNLDLKNLSELADECSKIFTTVLSKNEYTRATSIGKTESHKKLLSLFEETANSTEGSKILPLINECKKYLLKMDNSLLSINKFDNYVLSVLDKICETERNLIALWKPHNL